ncbi:MAG TPA: divergent PAP2 family protein [Spirochaetia bacterium]|nr:divergent PAP2 family protein [Spirochaetia bacterium]
MPLTLPLSASLITAVIVQLACQAFKVVVNSVRERRLALSWFFSTGGMPSAHSAFVTALSVSIGLRSGFQSELFAVAFVFSIIVIYDSWRLRGAVQHQAKIIKMLARDRPDVPAGELRENTGHSPAEIVAGVLAGGGLALLGWLLLR